MKITKLGHCCLIIETGGVRFMTDPGMFTIPEQENIEGIDAVVITHEHGDHFHLESLKKIIEKNPAAAIIANASVGKFLEKAALKYSKVGDGEATEVKGVGIAGYGKDHAPIYKEFGLVENTGYYFDGGLFYPGDAFYKPDRTVEVLALPVAGPWCKISESIDYAVSVKPKMAFPVHDGMLASGGFAHQVAKTILEKEGVPFTPMWKGDNAEF